MVHQAKLPVIHPLPGKGPDHRRHGPWHQEQRPQQPSATEGLVKDQRRGHCDQQLQEYRAKGPAGGLQQRGPQILIGQQPGIVREPNENWLWLAGRLDGVEAHTDDAEERVEHHRCQAQGCWQDEQVGQTVLAPSAPGLLKEGAGRSSLAGRCAPGEGDRQAIVPPEPASTSAQLRPAHPWDS